MSSQSSPSPSSPSPGTTSSVGLSTDFRLETLRRFLNFYFEPWGAAKAARWEAISGDRGFNPRNAEAICHTILASHAAAERIEKELP